MLSWFILFWSLTDFRLQVVRLLNTNTGLRRVAQFVESVDLTGLAVQSPRFSRPHVKVSSSNTLNHTRYEVSQQITFVELAPGQYTDIESLMFFVFLGEVYLKSWGEKNSCFQVKQTPFFGED